MAENKGDTPLGAPVTALPTLGHDPQKDKFADTWIDSMTSHLWIYEGSLGGTARILTLDTEGPDITALGKLAKYRDVIEIKSPDHKAMTSSMLGEDGQ